MGHLATSLDEQIALLRSRNMIISDPQKAKEILFYIGYYRLGFYWFPFEITYPKKHHRDHTFKDGTDFDTAVQLYLFDSQLRTLLIEALSSIEIDFRTKVIYIVSNKFRESPTWFVDTMVVNNAHSRSFFDKVYQKLLDKNPVIGLHHSHHINDKFAPAWKTLEFMTLGEVVNLFKAIKEDNIKLQIANEYGIKTIPTFENYLNLIRNLRNSCAHGNVLFDFKPGFSIRKGPAMMKGIGENQNLNGALHVVFYLLGRVSSTKGMDLKARFYKLISEYANNESIRTILQDISGLNLPS